MTSMTWQQLGDGNLAAQDFFDNLRLGYDNVVLVQNQAYPDNDMCSVLWQ